MFSTDDRPAKLTMAYTRQSLYCCWQTISALKRLICYTWFWINENWKECSMVPSSYHSLGKFTVEYFYVKIVCVKIFSSSRGANENFLKTNYIKVKCVTWLTKLVYTLCYNSHAFQFHISTCMHRATDTNNRLSSLGDI